MSCDTSLQVRAVNEKKVMCEVYRSHFSAIPSLAWPRLKIEPKCCGRAVICHCGEETLQHHGEHRGGVLCGNTVSYSPLFLSQKEAVA